tara:strand:+ start:243 stop:461 length:219 start_codon:yes stop_codon:yes gene_type:complete
MPNLYEVVHVYIYEDSEHTEVVAESEEEAMAIAEQERQGPDCAWNHASLSQDYVYEVRVVEEDVDKEDYEYA